MNLGSLGRDAVERFGEYENIHFEGKWYTNLEMLTHSDRLGNALKSIGIKKGDRVAINMANSPVVLWSFPAIFKVGAVAVPINPVLRPEQTAHILADSGAKAVVTSPEYVPGIQAARKEAPGLEHVIVTERDDMPGTVGYESLVSDMPETLEIEETDNDDLAALLYTAGTTGRSKGVMHTHFGLYMTALGFADFVNRCYSTTVELSTSHLDARTRERVEVETKITGISRMRTGLLVLPLSHAYGLAITLTGGFVAARGVVMKWFDPGQALQLIQDFRISAFAGVPAMYVLLLNHPDFDRYDLSSLQECLCGAAPLSREVAGLWREKTGIDILEGWGMTETTATTCGNRPDRPPKPGSAGVCMIKANTVKVFDDYDREVPVGQTGELVVKGPTVMKGYWNRPGETAEAMRNGWLHSGDVGHMDDEGDFFITGRKKDIIIRGGENVSPVEVEEVLLLMPRVADAGVIGIPDEVYGEEIKAFVVLSAGGTASPEEITAHCRQKLPNFKVPKVIQIVDTLPKNLLGKLMRSELRKMEKRQ